MKQPLKIYASCLVTQITKDTLAANWLMLFGLFAFALVIRLFALDHLSLWIDEIHTAVDSSLSSAKLWLEAPTNKPPFYYQFVGFFWHFGDSEFSLRLPSAFIGAACVIPSWYVGRQFFSRRLSLLLVLFVALSPLYIRYSQEARQYIFIAIGWIFFCLLVFQLLEKLKQTSLTVKDCAWLALPSMFMMQVHLTAFIYILSAICTLSFVIYFKFYAHKRFIKYIILFSIMPILTLATWLIPLSLKVVQGGETMHILPHTLLSSFVSYTKATFINWLIAILSAIGLFRFYKNRDKVIGLACILLVILPFIFIWAIGLVKPILVSRIFLPGHFICLLGLVFLVNECSQPKKIILSLIISASIMHSTYKYFHQFEKTDWRGAITAINQQLQPQDLIMSDRFGMLKPFYVYGLAQLDKTYLLTRKNGVPAGFATTASVWSSRCFERSCDGLNVDRLPFTPARVWYLTTAGGQDVPQFKQFGAEVAQLLQRQCDIEDVKPFNGLKLVLFSCTLPPPITNKANH